MFTIRQYAFMYAALMASAFAGASVVHAVFQPDLTLPQLGAPQAAGAAPAAAGAAAAPAGAPQQQAQSPPQQLR